MTLVTAPDSSSTRLARIHALAFHTSIVQEEWRQNIIERFEQRHLREEKPFEDVINVCRRLFEGVALHGHSVDHRGSFGTCISSEPTPASVEQDRANLQKLYQVQEELRDLLKRRENQILLINELKSQLEKKEKLASDLSVKLENTVVALETCVQDKVRLEQKTKDLQEQLKYERDEHQALQILYESLNKNLTIKTKEYYDLADQWKRKCDDDFRRVKQENERTERAQRDRKRRELEQAAAAIQIDESRLPSTVDAKPDPIRCVASVPSQVLYSMDQAHDGEVHALKWSVSASRGGEFLASGGSDRKVYLWTMGSKNYQLKESMTGSNGAITSIDILNDNILASSTDYSVRLWSIADGKLKRTLTGHSDKVLTAKFLGCISSRAVTGSSDRTLRMWDFDRYACTATLYPGSTCNDLVVRNTADMLISGHLDKKVRFWDLKSQSSANDILLAGRVTSLDISPNGYYLLASVRDDSLKLLDFRQDQVVKTFVADGFKVGHDWSRAYFSPDNQYVISGSVGGSVFIWDVNSGKLEKVLKAPTSTTIIVTCWNQSGCLVASADRNKRVVLWS